MNKKASQKLSKSFEKKTHKRFTLSDIKYAQTNFYKLHGYLHFNMTIGGKSYTMNYDEFTKFCTKLKRIKKCMDLMHKETEKNMPKKDNTDEDSSSNDSGKSESD